MQRQSYLSLLLTLFLFLIVLSGCDLADSLFNPEEKIYLELQKEKEEVLPMELLVLSLENEFPIKDLYPVKIGNERAEASLTSDKKFVVLIPDIAPGFYDIEINLGDFTGKTDIYIRQVPPDINHQVIWETFKSGALETEGYLESISQNTGIVLSSDNKAFLSNLLVELESTYEALSNEEKQLAALFIQSNPYIFNSETKSSFNDNQEVLEAFKNYLSENMYQLMLSGSTFALSLTAPEPTGVTKFIAIASGIYLLKKALDLGMNIMSIYTKKVVLESSTVSVPKTDFTVLNHEEIHFNILQVNRTFFKDDLNSSIPLVTEVAGLIEKTVQILDQINGYIISFRQKFNLGQGGLGNMPQRLSQKTTYASENLPGDGMLADIDILSNNNVKSAVIARGEHHIRVRFSTCEDDYQQFTFGYVYDRENLNITSNYEALLIATPIIYNEFTDPRDGYKYKTITIGEQEWFAENLRYNGPEVSGICPVQQESNCQKFGRIYDVDDALIACPPGWHLPDDSEWKQLEAFLGMPAEDLDNWDERGKENRIGEKLKSCDNWLEGWPQNHPGTNATGFTALPAGGHRYPFGGDNITLWFGRRGIFWTSSRTDSGNEYPNRIVRELSDSHAGILRSTDMWHHYYSVRCVRN